MNIEEFIKKEQENLEKFKKFYLAGMEHEPLDYPTTMNEEDWVDQYFSYLSIQGNDR
jgi:hypothetical protein